MRKIKAINLAAKSMPTYINAAFLWDSTDEGGNYWERIYHRFCYVDINDVIVPNRKTQDIAGHIDKAFRWDITDDQQGYWLGVFRILNSGS